MLLTDTTIDKWLTVHICSHLLLLSNKLSQNSVVQSKHSVVFIGNVDQELGLGTVRMAYHCSMISDASARNTQKLGVFEWLRIGIIWRQLYLHMPGGWCWLLTKPWLEIAPQYLHGPLCGLWLLYSTTAGFQQQAASFLRPGPRLGRYHFFCVHITHIKGKKT